MAASPVATRRLEAFVHPLMIGRLLSLLRGQPHPAPAPVPLVLDSAIAQINSGQAGMALANLRETIAQHPRSAEAWLWLARCYAANRQIDDALESYGEAADLASAPGPAALIRGEQARAGGDVEEAVAELTRARDLLPGEPEACNQLGLALEAANRRNEAEQVFRDGLRLAPNSQSLLNNLGALIFRQQGIDPAIVFFDDALRRRPDDASLRYNFAVLCGSAGRAIRAVTLYREALSLKPDLHAATLNLALVLFQLGRLPEAGEIFEARWDIAAALDGAYTFDRDMQWRGEALDGKRIFLWAEQGLGDTLQMIRYVPLVVARGAAAVHVRVPRTMLDLFAQLPGVTSWISEDDRSDKTKFDLHCPFMSLPLAFGTTLATIPATLPYLRAAPQRVAYWRERLPPRPARARIGLVWSSGQWGDMKYDEQRVKKSLPLAEYAALTAIIGVTWISLQIGAGRDELAHSIPGQAIVDPADGIRDFADTAAIVEQLDLVITVDTSVAHLAGAMGKPVLMLLQYSSGMFWLTERDDSPWYPGTLRIVRQSVAGDWAGTVVRARNIVEAFLDQRSLWNSATR